MFFETNGKKLNNRTRGLFLTCFILFTLLFLPFVCVAKSSCNIDGGVITPETWRAVHLESVNGDSICSISDDARDRLR
jgi:hypothetical protein